MTGEALPVRKEAGSAVFAGTVVDEGECCIRVTQVTGSGRYDRIVRMIEESEKLKSETESRASHLADRLVPWSLGGTALAWLLTRNVSKALAILMVDYSCALKLAMPVSVLSAMRQAGEHHIDVKGGKFMEAVADADTIVFDKTGTLTHAQPKLAKIIPFGGQDETEMLRIAACLEEHFPHSIANAVVKRAAELGVEHSEMHTKVEYVVAHGIASTIDGRKVLIGSYHFIFEDEGTVIGEEEQKRFEELPREHSHLYLALDGKLAAVLLIEDPLRPDARKVIDDLHKAGFSKVCMMTGDSRHTAARVAAELGLDEYEAEVLPEDKAAYIRREHKLGRKVIMVGDGVNDSPALSEADAGIAIAAGAAIAREVADITISADDLHEILVLRTLSRELMKRINWNYRSIMGFNSMLILLGVLGVITPAMAALLHNTSTIAISLKSMTDLLERQ
jgi:heavy metal translocating P-type ATPase